MALSAILGARNSWNSTSKKSIDNRQKLDDIHKSTRSIKTYKEVEKITGLNLPTNELISFNKLVDKNGIFEFFVETEIYSPSDLADSILTYQSGIGDDGYTIVDNHYLSTVKGDLVSNLINSYFPDSGEPLMINWNHTKKFWYVDDGLHTSESLGGFKSKKLSDVLVKVYTEIADEVVRDFKEFPGYHDPELLEFVDPKSEYRADVIKKLKSIR